MHIDELIKSRENTHGDYAQKAEFIQLSKEAIRINTDLSYVQKESLDNIIQKIGRIVYGDDECKDHWDDIAWYATLAAKQIEDNEKKIEELSEWLYRKHWKES